MGVRPWRLTAVCREHKVACVVWRAHRKRGAGTEANPGRLPDHSENLGFCSECEVEGQRNVEHRNGSCLVPC